MISHVGSALNRRFARLFVRGSIVVLIIVLAAQAVYHQAHQAARAEENTADPVSEYKANLASLPLSFIVNAGQIEPDVRFEVRGMGGNLYFAPSDVTLIFPGAAEDTLSTIRLHHIGANPDPVLTGVDLQPGVVNYLLGNDASQWYTNIPTYAGVFYEELYPGITLHYDGTTGLLKGTYLIAPGADPGVIRWQYDGIQRAQVDPATHDLRLYLSAEADTPYLTEYAPHAWQEIDNQRVPVDVGYTLSDDQSIGLTLGDYDPALTLFLDPLLQYGTYFGGANADEGFGIAADALGNAYVTGRTNSLNIPRTGTYPSYQHDNAGGDDAFIMKINISAQQLMYSTFLGGTSADQGNDIAIDAAGNAYVTGETMSDDFPFPVGGVSYDNSFQGGTDAFVVKMSPTGVLLYSTYLGGGDTDRGYAVAVNAAGNVYVTGETVQSIAVPFPIVNALGGMSAPPGGSADAFVTKFLADGSGLAFSTYLGGSAIDVGGDIGVDASNNVYIVGRTESTNFPLHNPGQGTYGGSGDAFVTKLTSGSPPSYVYSTYMGGSGFDAAAGLATGSAGMVYVTGETESDNIPLVSALPPEEGGTYNGGKDAFVAALSNSGTRVRFTYLGGTNLDKGAAIALDTSGDIYVVGETQSGMDADPLNNFPIKDGFQAGFGGLSDAFITKIVASTSTIEFSSFIGGTFGDQGYGLAVVGGGTIYMTGDADSDNFPITENSFQRGGNTDAFIIRIGATEADLSITKYDDIQTVAVGQNLPYTITVQNLGPDATIATMTDQLNSYFAYVSGTFDESGTCSYDVATRLVTCELGEMQAGTEKVIHLVLNVTSRPTIGSAANTARVSGTEFDPNDDINEGTQNSYPQTTQVIYQADLEVTKLSSRYRVRQDEDIVFTVSIRNIGPGTMTEIELTDMLPPDLVQGVVTPPTGTTFNSTTGVWNVGTMAPNTTVTLTIPARVKDTTPLGTVITNTASITHKSAQVPDPNSDNNTSTVELRVVTEVPDTGCHPSPTNPNEIICLFG